MAAPIVSIIIPVYNVEHYLDRCVNSVLNQTLKDIEIILVDDGSPDNCPQLCDEYAAKHDNIRVVHKANAGLGMACNSGLDVATGKYVAFVDSDDWVDSDMYATMVAEAEAHSAQMVFTGLKRVDENGNELGRLPHKDNIERYVGENVLRLMRDMIASEPSTRYDRDIQVSAKVVLYNVDFLRSNQLRFVSERQYLSEDLLFNVSSLLKCNAAIVLPAYFYNYFVNTSSITSTLKANHIDKLNSTIQRLHELINDESNVFTNSENDIRLKRYIIGEIRSYTQQIASSKIPYNDKLNLLRKTNGLACLEDVDASYPFDMMPKIHRIPYYLLRHKLYRLLLMLYKLK